MRSYQIIGRENRLFHKSPDEIDSNRTFVAFTSNVQSWICSIFGETNLISEFNLIFWSFQKNRKICLLFVYFHNFHLNLIGGVAATFMKKYVLNARAEWCRKKGTKRSVLLLRVNAKCILFFSALVFKCILARTYKLQKKSRNASVM